MSRIYEFPRQDSRYDEASVWIARLDRELSEEETTELKAWMAADAENAAVLESMARLWDKMDALSRLGDLFPVSRRRNARFWFHGLSIAASIAIAALIGMWVFVDMKAQSDTVYETAVGEQSTVRLSDGTRVVLNTNSLLRVEYRPSYRLLVLERGEIDVHVAKDASRPLSVIAEDKLIQAVGTVFNVEITDEHNVELVVTEGKVRVGVDYRGRRGQQTAKPRVLAESSRAVAAGEAVVLGEAKEEVTPVSPEEIEVKLSWRNGNLIFRGEPLEEALKEVGRYTTVEFVFLNDDLRKRAVAGYFKAGDVDGLLVALRENFNITCTRVDEHTVSLDSP